MKYIPIIIILVLILVIIIAAFLGVRYIQRKVRKFSQMAFGTDDIFEGAEQMKKEYSTTPKSVSAMTSLLLPKISADFPSFEYNEMKERAENVLTSYLRAVTEKKMGLLHDVNEELERQLENHINMLSANGLREHFDMVKIHRTEITSYKKSAGQCIITFQTSLECYHYITEGSSKITEGSKEYKYQTRFNTDLIYIQNPDLIRDEAEDAWGINCPNCGAPITSLGHKKCEYCGTPVIEINRRAWSFSNIEEVE